MKWRQRAVRKIALRQGGNHIEEGNLRFGIGRAGRAATVQVRMSIDLYEFFGQQGYEEIIGLALDIGGRRGDMTRISLDAQPKVSTPYGEIVYPGRITIISNEYR